jgi:hypothetical protein
MLFEKKQRRADFRDEIRRGKLCHATGDEWDYFFTTEISSTSKISVAPG